MKHHEKKVGQSQPKPMEVPEHYGLSDFDFSVLQNTEAGPSQNHDVGVVNRDEMPRGKRGLSKQYSLAHSLVVRNQYVDCMTFLGSPKPVFLDCGIKGFVVEEQFWRDLVPYVCKGGNNTKNNYQRFAWLSEDHINFWMELMIRDRPPGARYTVAKTGTSAMIEKSNKFVIETDFHLMGMLDGSSRPYPSWDDVDIEVFHGYPVSNILRWSKFHLIDSLNNPHRKKQLMDHYIKMATVLGIVLLEKAGHFERTGRRPYNFELVYNDGLEFASPQQGNSSDCGVVTETERGCIMYDDMSYAKLHEMLKKKFNMEEDDRINISVSLPSFDSRMEITDNEEGEIGPCWSWWMSVLKECIGDHSNLLFISDRHPAIALAVHNEFPLSYHAVCCRHLMMNLSLKKKTTKGVQPDAYQFRGGGLCQAGTQRWSRAHCPLVRYNYMTSNSVESVNACSVINRKLPVLMLAETYSAMLKDMWLLLNVKNLQINCLMKLQEAIDEEAILEEQILALMHRFADRFTDRRVEINNMMVLHDHPLVDYGKYALGCMTGADMKKCVYLKSVMDELLRSMEEKRQLMATTETCKSIIA
ncbi:transposase, MuDR, MULE transposase domain protein [Tanacetum coccineum]